MGAIRSERSGKGCTRHVAGKAREGWQGSGPNYSSGGPVQPSCHSMLVIFRPALHLLLTVGRENWGSCH